MLLQIVLRIFHIKSAPIQSEKEMSRKGIFKIPTHLFPKLWPTNILYNRIFKSLHKSNDSVLKYIKNVKKSEILIL